MEIFCPWFTWHVLCASCICVDVYFLSLWEDFFYTLVKDLVCALTSGTSNSLMPIIWRFWYFHAFPHFLFIFSCLFHSSSFFVLGPRLKFFLIHNTSKVFFSLLIVLLDFFILSLFQFSFSSCSYHFIKSPSQVMGCFCYFHTPYYFLWGAITQTAEVHLFKIFLFHFF